MGISAAALHGEITQGQREKILQEFRNRQVKVLVATDVAARGIDVQDLTHVVNYSLPQSPESYVHRIGRTGRAGKKGIAITFVIPSERRKLEFVERINRCKIKKQVLPTIHQVIKNREAQIKTVLENIIEANEGSKYASMAKELLEKHNPEEVVAAILKYSFKTELELNSYKAISETIESPDRGRQRQRPGRDRFNKRSFGKRPGKKQGKSSFNRKR
jgi:ATP-dependent RNA helicase DeaD